MPVPMPPDNFRVLPDQPVPQEPVTFFAWIAQPQVEVALDGTPVDVRGDTLYLWSLGEAPR
jgi:hypothetical protein